MSDEYHVSFFNRLVGLSSVDSDIKLKKIGNFEQYYLGIFLNIFT